VTLRSTRGLGFILSGSIPPLLRVRYIPTYLLRTSVQKASIRI
jgi:hypothetical protein